MNNIQANNKGITALVSVPAGELLFAIFEAAGINLGDDIKLPAMALISGILVWLVPNK